MSKSRGRKCCKCKGVEPEIEFYPSQHTGGYCKSCHRAYYNKKLGPDGHLYFFRYTKARRKEWRERIVALKVERGCFDCAERHPACLEYHHIDRATKAANINDLISHTVSWEVVEREVAKCVVLCSNCHRKRHYHEKHAAAQSVA